MPKFTKEQWLDLTGEVVDRLRELSDVKGGEYAVDGDRLDNFRRAATRLGVPMDTVWWIYAGKHWDALTTYVKDEQCGASRRRSEPIESRVDDLIVYLILYRAILQEKREANNAPKTPKTGGCG